MPLQECLLLRLEDFLLLRACMGVLLALACRRLGFSKEGMKLKTAY
jgi:hypothetical protein